MKSIFRLKKNYQYNYVYKHAKSVADGNFVLLFCQSNSKQSKVGFSVSKKFGNAVQRNRVRRQMKAAVATVMNNVLPSHNFILIPRKQGQYLFADVLSSVQNLFAKAGMLK